MIIFIQKYIYKIIILIIYMYKIFKIHYNNKSTQKTIKFYLINLNQLKNH